MTAERSSTYASALLEVARSEGALADVEDELFRFARLLEANDDLRTTLTDQALPVSRRQQIVEDLLGGRANPVTTSLVSMVVGTGRAKDLPAIIDELVQPERRRGQPRGGRGPLGRRARATTRSSASPLPSRRPPARRSSSR